MGCEQGPEVKGIRELGRYEKEPTIEVVKEDGKTETLDFEEYIVGVVAGEMENGWPREAYGAQAILARTFALQYLEENNTRMISGAYQFAQEYNPEKVTDKIRKGVSLTRGEAIVYDDRFIKGWFHASAGGQTTTAQVGIGYEKREPKYTKTVKSPDQQAPEDVKNWEVSFTGEEIKTALEKLKQNPGPIKDIEIIDKDQSGRIINLRFSGDNDTIDVKAAKFRRELDPQKLKSTKIDNIEKTEEGFFFSGSGYGHGVGMSQWGAYSLALGGRSPEEIVEHYFSDIEIVKVYD